MGGLAQTPGCGVCDPAKRDGLAWGHSFRLLQLQNRGFAEKAIEVSLRDIADPKGRGLRQPVAFKP